MTFRGFVDNFLDKNVNDVIDKYIVTKNDKVADDSYNESDFDTATDNEYEEDEQVI